MKKWKIYLINLARSKDRLATCARQFDSHDLSFERINAFDGDELSPTELSRLYDFRQSSYHKQLTSGEVACYLSHVRSWQKIVDEQLDYGVIFEDDILLEDDIKQGLEAIQNISEPWDLIKLAESPVKRKVVHNISAGDFSLVTYNKIPIRSCAQVISLAGAKKLLANNKDITRPVDVELQYWWESDLNVFGLQPYVVQPDQTLESEIDRDQRRKKAKQSFPKKVVSGFYFLFKNKIELNKRLEDLSK
jgi:glycosyl transferase family 25